MSNRDLRQKRAQAELEVELERLELEKALWGSARSALAKSDPDFARIQETLNGFHATIGGAADTVTPHEKYLDRRRVIVTGGLVLALFLIVGVIVLKQNVSTAATPYVSLLSGLAGIALGWMFATSGGQSAKVQPNASTSTSGKGSKSTSGKGSKSKVKLTDPDPGQESTDPDPGQEPTDPDPGQEPT